MREISYNALTLHDLHSDFYTYTLLSPENAACGSNGASGSIKARQRGKGNRFRLTNEYTHTM